MTLTQDGLNELEARVRDVILNGMENRRAAVVRLLTVDVPALLKAVRAKPQAHTPVIADYDPNLRWGEQHVEIVLKQWAHETTQIVKIGGNTRGVDVMKAAISRLIEDLADAPENLVLKNVSGDTLVFDDHDEDFETMIENMCVSARIIHWDPPSINEVRRRNGADAAEGRRDIRACGRGRGTAALRDRTGSHGKDCRA
jgi:hypothetical protein